MCDVNFGLNSRICSLVTSPEKGCRCSEDGLGNCVHVPGTVMCHSQNLECLIRSSEIMTLHNNYSTALTEETLVLVDLATNSHLRLPGPCGMSQM